MSMEQLKADLKESVASVKKLDPVTTSAADIVRLMKDTVFPTFEAIVEEMDEIDQCVADIVDGSEDILTQETGQKLAAGFLSAAVLVDELEKRAAGDTKLVQAIKEWRALASECNQIIAEVTLDEPDDDDVEPDDDDDDEDDDKEGEQP